MVEVQTDFAEVQFIPWITTLRYWIGVEETNVATQSIPEHYGAYKITLYAQNISEDPTLAITTQEYFSIMTQSIPYFQQTDVFDKWSAETYEPFAEAEVREIYSYTIVVPNDGATYTIDFSYKLPEYNIDILLQSIFKVNNVLAPHISMVYCNMDFKQNKCNTRWDVVSLDSVQYYVTLYHTSKQGSVPKIIKQILTPETTVEFSELPLNMFKPGDKLYCGVRTVNVFGVRSDETFSNEIIFGDAAKYKTEASEWTDALTYVKVHKTFKPVRKVWVKVDGEWILTIDN